MTRITNPQGGGQMTFDPNANVPPVGYAQPLQYASPGVKPLLPVLGRAKAATICFWCLLAAQVLMAILLLGVAVNPDMLEDEQSGAALLLIFGLVLLGSSLAFMVVSIVT